MELANMKVIAILALGYLSTTNLVKCAPLETSVIAQNTSTIQWPDYLEDSAVRHLRSYIRIRTAQPSPESGYRQAIPFLKALVLDIGLTFEVVDLGPDNLFAIIITWSGTDPSLKSILFNGHMDVVDSELEFWTYPPFEAHKDKNGNIFGRGASDMKSATMATLEALGRLKEKGFQPLRTIYLTILPDEEVGGLRGMKPFVASPRFKALNVGIDIDEGGVNPEPDNLRIYYGEKSSWQFRITAIDNEWHGSTLPEYTSGQRIQLVVDRLLAFRRQQFLKVNNSKIPLNQVTTVNLVGISGGIGQNTIPSKIWAEFDMRIPRTDYTFGQLETMLEGIVEEARNLKPSNISNVFLEYSLQAKESEVTVADSSNLWWDVVQQACQEMSINCPASFASPTSDARFVRSAGYKVFGIGPFLNTPFKAHTNNEFINEKEYLKGIDRYEVLIRHLAMQPANGEDKIM